MIQLESDRVGYAGNMDVGNIYIYYSSVKTLSSAEGR